MDEQVRDALVALGERGEPAGAEAVVARAAAEARRGHRPLRIAVTSFAAAAVVVALVAAAALAYVRAKVGDIERLPLAAELTGSAEVSEPMTVLVAGSDARDELGGPPRADTIMVLRLDPGAGTVAVLSLPRDLWLPIEGTGGEQRINTALAGGAGALVRTVQSVLGIDLDHYVQVDFDGFRRIVDAVGGVSVHVGAPARDRLAGLDLPTAGCQELDGDQALALVRSRHLQVLEGGRWVADPTGDLGRIGRQQRFLLAMLGEVGDTRNPVTLARLLEVAADEVAVDDGLGASELLDLGRRVGSYAAADVRFVEVPVTDDRVGEAAVLRATPEDLLAAGTALLLPPAAPTGPAVLAAPTTTAPPACG